MKPAILSRASQAEVQFRQRFVPHSANLQFLSCGEFSVPPGCRSVSFCRHEEESLLFMWKGSVTVELGDTPYVLAPYDTLYVPRGVSFRLHNAGPGPPRSSSAARPPTRRTRSSIRSSPSSRRAKTGSATSPARTCT